jgi:hypothetical protein
MTGADAAPPRPPVPFALRLAGEIAVVAALLLVAFTPSLSLHFLANDSDWLAVAKHGSAEIPEFASYGAFRPMAVRLFRTAYGAFGLDPVPYRVSLLLLHGTAAVLAGRLAARILRRPAAGWITAAIFSVAPASSECIRSISAFVYPCVTVLVLGGLVLYARAVERGAVLPWAGALALFAAAAPLREHFVVALPIALLLELRSGGLAALRRKGPWLRLGPVLAVGLLYMLVRQGISGLPLVPKDPMYRFDGPMASRFLVTIQRLVLPTIPLEILQYRVFHIVIGAGLVVVVMGIALRSPVEDRRSVYVLLGALALALLPFLPVFGDHVRQRFAYLATAFAAGIVAFLICVGSERVSPRLTLPAVLAILAGLLLELQGDFVSYHEGSVESKARFEIYPIAERAVLRNDRLAVFAGPALPDLQGARSTFRVVTNQIQRPQVIRVEAASPEDLAEELRRFEKSSGATGGLQMFTRFGEAYRIESMVSADHVAQRVFITPSADAGRARVIILAPHPSG